MLDKAKSWVDDRNECDSEMTPHLGGIDIRQGGWDVSTHISLANVKASRVQISAQRECRRPRRLLDLSRSIRSLQVHPVRSWSLERKQVMLYFFLSLLIIEKKQSGHGRDNVSVHLISLINSANHMDMITRKESDDNRSVPLIQIALVWPTASRGGHRSPYHSMHLTGVQDKVSEQNHDGRVPTDTGRQLGVTQQSHRQSMLMLVWRWSRTSRKINGREADMANGGWKELRRSCVDQYIG